MLLRTGTTLSILVSSAARRSYGMVGKRGVVRRVYETVEFSKVSDGYTVLLDSKPLKTPKVGNNQFGRVCCRTCTF